MTLDKVCKKKDAGQLRPAPSDGYCARGVGMPRGRALREGLRRVAGAIDPNAVHGAIILLADPPMCRRAFTNTAVGLKTPKRCEVNCRARAMIDNRPPRYYGYWLGPRSMKEGAHGPLQASPFVRVICSFAGEAKLRQPGPAP
jgi:hypothetical protein